MNKVLVANAKGRETTDYVKPAFTIPKAKTKTKGDWTTGYAKWLASKNNNTQHRTVN
jgi:hypothetical protein